MITLQNKLTNLFFYLSILFFIIGFNFRDAMVGNWYQQFLPMPTGGSVRDIYFVDSLLGFAVSDSCILKTTNGGDNWIIKQQGYYILNRIKFINRDTGFACGGNNKLLKTINSGENWIITTPSTIFPFDMAVLNSDTIWLASSNPVTGGVFRTTNGGLNWTQQFSGGNQNPNKIYMYNARMGFMSNSSALPNIYKTSNSGVSWNIINSGEKFIQMFFVDSLTGWRTKGDTMKFTSNGGLSWSRQLMPYGGMIFSSNLLRFSVLNRDTIWGCGGYVLYPNNRVKSIIYRTTNGGGNWFFQIPDTSLLPFESYIQFTDKYHGWAYSSNITPTGIHTTNGGDTTFLIGVQQITNNIPKDFKLYQNYPNPFNPKTNIKYEIAKSKNVILRIYDITGKEIISLVNQKQNAGTYEVDFSGSGYSSGVYFYSLIIDGKLIDTKKMILIK